MRCYNLLPVVLGISLAQDLDFDVLDQVPPLTTATIPVVYQTADVPAATAVTISYSQSAILAAVSSAIESNPDLAAPLNTSIIASPTFLQKRSTAIPSSQCQAQPTGSGPIPSPDSASAFLTNPAFASIASKAPLPSGYTNTFTNLNKAGSAYGYLGYTTLKSYDTQLCASKCSAIKGCQGFNVYFERDPSLNPDAEPCKDPQSTTQIKCSFWGAPVLVSDAINAGQTRNKFQVVIAGSNGYYNQNQVTPKGYASAYYLNNLVINATGTCNGDSTFLRSVIFNSGPFDPSLCATACTAQNDYNADGTPSSPLCRFFNTYLIYKNGRPIAQNCVMYTKSWTPAVASNSGYQRNDDAYTFGSSWIYSNATDAGTCGTSSSSSASSSSQTSSSASSSSVSSSSSSSASVSSSSSTSTSVSSSTSSAKSSTSVTITSSIIDSGTSTTGTIVPAGKISPSPVIPTTTDINGIKPAATHQIDSRAENTDGTYHFVAINATAPDGMVSIEKFIPFIQKTDCSSSLIKLTFKNSDALRMAQQSWPKSQFPLSTIDGYCGDGKGSRTYYNVASVAFDSTDNLASLTVAIVNSPTEVFSRITLEWGSVNSSSQSTPISNEASGGPSGRRKTKRSGFDKETTISIDTSTWIDTISQFLWGYNLGRSITDPAALSDIKGYDEINPYMLSNDPKNYYNESTQYGSSFHFDNQLVSCPGCAFKTNVRIYGGYDWDGRPSDKGFNYIKGTFNAWNTDLFIGFKIQGKEGYSKKFSKTLAEFALPGIGVAKFLEVNPFVQLNTNLEFSIGSGTITAENIGIGYHQEKDFWLIFDFLHGKVSQQNWFSEKPHLLDPSVQYMPTTAHFSASIGPALGIEIDAFGFSSKGAIGLDTPKVTIDVSIDKSDGQNCGKTVDSISSTDPGRTTLNMGFGVGVGLYGTYEVSNVFVGELTAGRIPIGDFIVPVGSVCVNMHNDQVNVDTDPGFI